MYRVSDIHHVAIGVKSLETMKSFYRDALEFTNVFVEIPEAEHGAMREVLRMTPVFAAILFAQAAGGINVELTKMVDPVPRPIRKDFRYGDIGVAKIAIPVSNLERLYRDLKGRFNFCSRPKRVAIPGWGDYHFVYCRDPEGNLIEFVSAEKFPVPARFGGARWLGVSVTDLGRSMPFYQKHLGFDTVVINTHESFSGLVNEISGDQPTRVRSCLLGNSRGDTMIELFEVMEPRGRSIPFATNWGDFGYLQVCLSCDNVPEVAAYCEKEGIDFLTRPQTMDDERAGSFIYVRDPDGIPVEFLAFNQ